MPHWYDVAIVALRAVWLLTYVVGDWFDARWLPWWRRYAPSVVLAVGLVLMYQGRRMEWIALCVTLVAIVLRIWNQRTAMHNRRNGNDHKKLEAQQRLTDVQARSFRQQVAEAH